MEEEVKQIPSGLKSSGKVLSVKESMTCVTLGKTTEKPDFKKMVRRNDTITKRKTKIKEILVIASKSKSLATSSDDKMNQTENNHLVEMLSDNLNSSSPLQPNGGNRLVVKELSNTLENEKSIAAFIKKFLDEEKFNLLKPTSCCGCEKLKEKIEDVVGYLGKLKIELDELRESVRDECETEAKARMRLVEDTKNDLEMKLVKVEKRTVEKSQELRTEIILCQSKLNDYSKADFKHYPVWTFAAFLAVYSIIYWTRRI